jgi:hypothetical protein
MHEGDVGTADGNLLENDLGNSVLTVHNFIGRQVQLFHPSRDDSSCNSVCCAPRFQLDGNKKRRIIIARN